MKVELATYNNNGFKPGGAIKRIIWYYVNLIFFTSGLFPFYALKVFLLKLFGAKIGTGVIIKPSVSIKYPWFLTIGNHVWIGEKVWIDNLAQVTIEDNVCISQGAILLTGSHDYKRTSFNLIVKEIKLEEGVWICAKAVVCAGVICHTQSIVTAGSVVADNCEANSIYKGNPALKISTR